jgi:superfamily II DNA helicase RecQ
MKEAIPDLSTRLGHVIKLKDAQKEAIEHLTRGRYVFAVLPTRYGKSLIFQLFIRISASTRPGTGPSARIICSLEHKVRFWKLNLLG